MANDSTIVVGVLLFLLHACGLVCVCVFWHWCVCGGIFQST